MKTMCSLFSPCSTFITTELIHSLLTEFAFVTALLIIRSQIFNGAHNVCNLPESLTAMTCLASLAVLLSLSITMFWYPYNMNVVKLNERFATAINRFTDHYVGKLSSNGLGSYYKVCSEIFLYLINFIAVHKANIFAWMMSQWSDGLMVNLWTLCNAILNANFFFINIYMHCFWWECPGSLVGSVLDY